MWAKDRKLRGNIWITMVDDEIARYYINIVLEPQN